METTSACPAEWAEGCVMSCEDRNGVTICPLGCAEWNGWFSHFNVCFSH